MSVTRVRDLIAVGVLFGVLSYFAVRAWYLDLPTLSWAPGAVLLVLGLFEFTMAARLRAVIGHDPDAKPMPAIVVARWVAIGRASAVAGAVISGLALGFTGFVIGQLASITSAEDDLVAGSVLAAGALVVAVGGAVLERAGIAPRPPDASAE